MAKKSIGRMESTVVQVRDSEKKKQNETVKRDQMPDIELPT
jgi:hypothetical protein